MACSLFAYLNVKFCSSEKDKKLNELEVSVEVAEKSLKDAREKEMKQKGNFEKVKENFCEQLNELKRINLDLKTSQKEEKEATSMSSIQLKVCTNLLSILLVLTSVDEYSNWLDTFLKKCCCKLVSSKRDIFKASSSSLLL